MISADWIDKNYFWIKSTVKSSKLRMPGNLSKTFIMENKEWYYKCVENTQKNYIMQW
jgi:hypothetical protein